MSELVRHNNMHVRKAFASKGDDVTLSRFVKIKNSPRAQLGRKQWKFKGIGQNPSITAGRSIFHRKGVKAPSELKGVLVSGHSNVKVGRDIRKGWARGYWIYTLSLEERRTCPPSCVHWESCYGNNMPWAKRVLHGPELEAALQKQVPRLLSIKNRVGVMVRLHALGDFYSVEYVKLWAKLLAQYPRLSVYGYTARELDSEIGRAIAKVKRKYGRRFAVRWSNGGKRLDCTVSIKTEAEKPKNAFLCPEQTNKTAACATCGLCWGTTRNVAFMEH